MRYFLVLTLLFMPLLLSAGQRDDIVETAKKYIGVRYKSKVAPGYVMDCSGFVALVYSKIDMTLPRSSSEQYRKAEHIPLRYAKKGDLVFFKIRKNMVSHVGIYIGDGRFIHSPSTGKRIRIENLSGQYWKRRFVGFARFIKN